MAGGYYGRWRAYGQSKLANLLFAYELQRRLENEGVGVISLACHPGYAATELQSVAARMEGAAWMEHLFTLANRLFAQDAATGSLPMLYAATVSDVHGGDYIGPDGLGEFWGHPVKVHSSPASHDARAAAHLWEVSQDLTGVRY